MTLTRQLLEEYLDGELPQPTRLQVEQALAADAAAGKLVERLRAQRALRQVAYAAYQPAEIEARQTASRFLADFRHAPLGFVGRWHTVAARLARVAAGIAIASACFVAGQYSIAAHQATPSTIAMNNGSDSSARTWVVEYQQSDGQAATREFSSLDAAQKFAQDMTKNTVQVAASDGGVL
jgi:anti-sigma factor RsiW